MTTTVNNITDDCRILRPGQTGLAGSDCLQPGDEWQLRDGSWETVPESWHDEWVPSSRTCRRPLHTNAVYDILGAGGKMTEHPNDVAELTLGGLREWAFRPHQRIQAAEALRRRYDAMETLQ